MKYSEVTYKSKSVSDINQSGCGTVQLASSESH